MKRFLTSLFSFSKGASKGVFVATVFVVAPVVVGIAWVDYAKRDLTVGLFQVRPMVPGEGVTVCIYNGAATWTGRSIAGGGTFRSMASSPRFTHRINTHSASDALERLREFHAAAKARGHAVIEIAVLDHASIANANIGGEPLSDEFYAEVAATGADLLLLGCRIAGGPRGEAYVQTRADRFGLRILAATDGISASGDLDRALKSGDFMDFSAEQQPKPIFR